MSFFRLKLENNINFRPLPPLSSVLNFWSKIRMKWSNKVVLISHILVLWTVPVVLWLTKVSNHSGEVTWPMSSDTFQLKPWTLPSRVKLNQFSTSQRMLPMPLRCLLTSPLVVLPVLFPWPLSTHSITLVLDLPTTPRVSTLYATWCRELTLFLGKDGKRQYNGLVDVYKKTIASDGIAGLYRGFAISCVGIFIYRGLYFGIYDTAKPIFIGENGSFMASFLLGWAVTVISGLASYPIDTIRRRMMMTSGTGKFITIIQKP